MRHELKSIRSGSEAAGTRIAVAMSGGVDSSVAAAVLVEAGYEVVGLTMQLYDHGALTAKTKTCCAGQDIYDARRVADALGIPHYVLDYENNFEIDVIKPFAEAYRRGETPIPCIQCNQTVKFRDLISSAREIGASALATGHYVRRVDGEQGPSLRRGVDQDRDQSYFLFATTREQLEFLRFPLGDLSKKKTRELAEKFSLAVAEKPDSQDICFVPTGKYTEVVKKYAGGSFVAGKIVHVDGREIGQHDGIENFTIGQRRGLGVGGERDPLYVVRVDPETNTVTAGPRSALARDSIVLRDINWLGDNESPSEQGERILARVRNAHVPVPATVFGDDATAGVFVRFDQPLYGVSPGQACVFYQEDRVLGGGWITRDHAVDSAPHNLRSQITATG
jgi:tRNA-specific 2-thiouridylase